MNDERLEIVLLHAFESPKKDWTSITFGFEVDNEFEKGFKPLDMWYNKKGILNQFSFDMYGRKVKAKFKYEPDLRNPNQMRRFVSEFELDGDTYTLI